MLVLGTLAIPFFSLRLGFSDAGSEPKADTTRQSYDLLAKGFGPGVNGPVQLVAPINGADDTTAFDKTLATLTSQPGVAGITPAIQLGSGPNRIAVAQLYPSTAPQAEATSTLLKRLRDQIIPDAAAGTGLQLSIGGVTATNADFSTRMAQRLPLSLPSSWDCPSCYWPWCSAACSSR